MTRLEAEQYFKAHVRPAVDEREVQNMMKIISEDAFGWQDAKGAASISPQEESRFREIVRRLNRSEPLQYILGQAHFYGFRFEVNPDVLIPRPETEELVHQVLQKGRQAPWKSGLDIGTGSGCIPITLKKERPDWRISGLDVSRAAIRVARRNADALGVDLDWHCLDILDESGWTELKTFDFIVSNPPYIPDEEKKLMPRQVLDFEPPAALFVPDENPLLFYQAIHRFALSHLNPGGGLFLEMNEFRAAEIRALIDARVFGQVRLIRDMQGKDRLLYCQKTS